MEKTVFLTKLLYDPIILLGFFSAFIASFFWMAAMTKFEISVAYPFMSLSFVFVLIMSSLFLGEAISNNKVVGILFITAGLIISARG